MAQYSVIEGGNARVSSAIGLDGHVYFQRTERVYVAFSDSSCPGGRVHVSSPALDRVALHELTLAAGNYNIWALRSTSVSIPCRAPGFSLTPKA
jgi:hypothetical protein